MSAFSTVSVAVIIVIIVCKFCVMLM